MPRRIKVGGTTYVVPNDATDDEITGIVDGKNGGGASTQAYDPAADAAAHAAAPLSQGTTAHPRASLAPGDSSDWQARLLGNDPTAAAKQVTKHITQIPSGIAHAVRHPLDTFVKPTVDAGRAALDSATSGDYSAAGQHVLDAIPIAGPWARNISNEAHDYGALPAIAGAGLDVAGGEALGKLPVAKTLGKAADVAQDTGRGLIHDTIGTLKTDVKRGKNPAQAYFDEGLGPSSSMESIKQKAGYARKSVGAKIPNMIDAADQAGVTIPARKVYSDAIRPPIDEMLQIKSGPGGGPTGPIKRYARTFDPQLNDAAANVDYLPSEVHGIKRNVAQNTAWSDPTMLDLKSVRQQTVGKLGSMIEDVVPGLEEVNDRYANVKQLERRAAERAANPASASLTKLTRTSGSLLHKVPLVGPVVHSVLDSVPVKTTAATTAYGLGTGLDTLAQGATTLSRRAPRSTRSAALVAPIASRSRER